MLSLVPAKKIFDATFAGDTPLAISQILSEMKSKSCVTVHFVYFANIWKQGVFHDQIVSKDYIDELQTANVLLPDGVAYRLLYAANKFPTIPGWKILLHLSQYLRTSVSNLNGTDFVPKFLSFFATKYPETRIILYGSRKEFSKLIIRKIESLGYKDIWYIDGYGEFDYTSLQTTKTCILLVGIGSPKQEEWVRTNREKIAAQVSQGLIFTVGGLFDFWSGVEKRAPAVVRKIYLEWLWRSITKPRKNLIKTLVSLCFFWVLLFAKRR